MILGSNLNRLVSKLNFWGGGVGSSPGMGGPGDGNGDGGPAPGGGPGQAGGTVGGGNFGGMSGGSGATGSAADGNLAASLGIGFAGQIGQGMNDNPGLTGGNVTNSMTFGKSLGNAVLAGTMTADQANQAIADANLGLMGTISANFGAMTGSTPGVVSVGMGALGPVTGAMGLGAALAGLTGQGALGGNVSGDGEGQGGGADNGLMGSPSIVPIVNNTVANKTIDKLGIQKNNFNLTDIINSDYPFQEALDFLSNEGVV